MYAQAQRGDAAQPSWPGRGERVIAHALGYAEKEQVGRSK